MLLTPPLPPCSVKLMHAHMNPKNGEKAPLIADDVFEIIMANSERLDSEIVYDRDFDYDYFGFKVRGRWACFWHPLRAVLGMPWPCFVLLHWACFGCACPDLGTAWTRTDLG